MDINIRRINRDDLVDEKLARQTRLEFEKFFGNGKEPEAFIVKDENANGANEFARLPTDVVKTLLKILNKVERGGIAAVSGKKGLVTPPYARTMIGVSHERFAEMIKNKEIKFHKHYNLNYVHMEDVIKHHEKVRAEQREALKTFSQEMQEPIT